MGRRSTRGGVYLGEGKLAKPLVIRLAFALPFGSNHSSPRARCITITAHRKRRVSSWTSTRPQEEGKDVLAARGGFLGRGEGAVRGAVRVRAGFRDGGGSHREARERRSLRVGPR